MSESAQETIAKIAEIAEAVGWQAGVGGMEMAGMIVSVLARHPDLTERFMKEGMGAFLDGDEADVRRLSPEHGRLTFHRAKDGAVSTPEELHIAIEVDTLKRQSGIDR